MFETTFLMLTAVIFFVSVFGAMYLRSCRRSDLAVAILILGAVAMFYTLFLWTWYVDNNKESQCPQQTSKLCMLN